MEGITKNLKLGTLKIKTFPANAPDRDLMKAVDIYESRDQNRRLINSAVSDKYVNESSASPFQL